MDLQSLEDSLLSKLGDKIDSIESNLQSKVNTTLDNATQPIKQGFAAVIAIQLVTTVIILTTVAVIDYNQNKK